MHDTSASHASKALETKCLRFCPWCEDVRALANPERIDGAELVACIVDKLVLSLTCTGVVQAFVFRLSGCRIAGPLALWPMGSALPMIVTIVIGEWRITLRNATTWLSVIMIARLLTWSSPWPAPPSLCQGWGGAFSSYEGDIEWEQRCARFMAGDLE